MGGHIGGEDGVDDVLPEIGFHVSTEAGCDVAVGAAGVGVNRFMSIVVCVCVTKLCVCVVCVCVCVPVLSNGVL